MSRDRARVDPARAATETREDAARDALRDALRAFEAVRTTNERLECANDA